MKDQLEKVIRDGKVAVLYSPGFGAGWFSWNESIPQCLYHPLIVELVEQKRHAEITEELCNTLFGESFYAGGSRDLRVVWLNPGTPFLIDEYDGSETLNVRDEMDYLIA